METKWWLNSTTVRGTLLTVVPTVVALLKLFGIEVADSETNTLVEGIASLAGIVGAVMAIVGRFQAKHQITVKK